MKRRQFWSANEDKLLKELMTSGHKFKTWREVSETLKTQKVFRSAVQVKMRWRYILDPEIDNSKLSPENNAKLFKLFIELGSSWKVIGNRLGNRTDHFVKNHFYSQMKIFLRKINCLAGVHRPQREVNGLKSAILTEVFRLAEEISFPGFESFFHFFIETGKMGKAKGKEISQELKNSIGVLLDRIIDENGGYLKKDCRKIVVKKIRKKNPGKDFQINAFSKKGKDESSKIEGLSVIEEKGRNSGNVSPKPGRTGENFCSELDSEDIKEEEKIEEEVIIVEEEIEQNFGKVNIDYIDGFVEDKENMDRNKELSNFFVVNDEYLMDIRDEFSLNK